MTGVTVALLLLLVFVLVCWIRAESNLQASRALENELDESIAFWQGKYFEVAAAHDESAANVKMLIQTIEAHALDENPKETEH